MIGLIGRVFVDTYVPGRGWQFGDSVSVQSTGAHIVTRVLAGSPPDAEGFGAAQEYLLQGGLLTVLAELLRRSTEADAAPRRNRRSELIAEIRNYIDLHYAEPISVGSMAALFRLSANHLTSTFSRVEGVGLYAYLLQKRLQTADTLLKHSDLLVKEVAYRVGFSDPLYFCRLYKQRFGYPPSQAR